MKREIKIIASGFTILFSPFITWRIVRWYGHQLLALGASLGMDAGAVFFATLVSLMFGGLILCAVILEDI
ncbi:MAG: hypothetical protein KGJ95_10480 [Candidatus Omnitrophica bacterium]|nr:hypothetical protein [Candidatus Omnitrophota bacterium]